jgi:hypothetical protein
VISRDQNSARTCVGFKWQFFWINTLARASALLIYVPLWNSRHIDGRTAYETRIREGKCLMRESGCLPYTSESCYIRRDPFDLCTCTAKYRVKFSFCRPKIIFSSLFVTLVQRHLFSAQVLKKICINLISRHKTKRNVSICECDI